MLTVALAGFCGDGPSPAAFQAGPARLTAGGLQACTADFYRARQLTAGTVPGGALPAARAEICLGGEIGQISPETLRTLAELTAPALLLLLAPGPTERIQVSLDQDSVRLTWSRLPAESVARRILPVLLGVVVAVLADLRRGSLPGGLLRFPRLVAESSPGPGGSTARAELVSSGLLDRRRMTRLTAESAEGALTVFAQESLTMLYLHAREAIWRLAPAGARRDIRRLVVGQAPLPVDAGTAPVLAPRSISPRVSVSNSPPAASLRRHGRARSKAPRAVLALVQADSLRRETRWVAKVIASSADVSVLICPWWLLSFTQGGAVISGKVWKVGDRSGALRRAVVRDQEIDVLYFDAASGAGRPRTWAERQALRRLAPLDIVHGRMRRRVIIRRLLLEASRRGVVTNAGVSSEFWGAKHGLEFMLRTYERLGGPAIPRPVTYSAQAVQVPIVVQALSRRGMHVIVKPTYGSLGRGLVTVRPGSSAGLVVRPGRYVVQELVRDPLLADGRKVDFRCHVMIDPQRRAASGWVPPILARVAGAPYVRGAQEAENVNLTYQVTRGLPSIMLPLPDALMLSAKVRGKIQREVRSLSDQLVDAYFALGPGLAAEQQVGRRVFLWGFDVAVSMSGGQVRAYLLENNTRPQLHRNQPVSDAAMASLIRRDHLHALLRQLPAGQPEPRPAGQRRSADRPRRPVRTASS